MKGKFIVFEGIDGSGSSTQAQLLFNRYQTMGFPAHLTSEPSSGPIGNMIRQGMSGRLNFSKGISSGNSFDLFDQQMAYLFAADRHDHLHNPINGVFKNIDSGVNVISTRYYFSSLAYHASSDYEKRFVEKLNSSFPDPDLLVYLECPVEVSIDRLNRRSFKDEYENAEKLRIVKENYKKIIDSYNGNKIIVDATSPVDNISDMIWRKVESLNYGL